MPQVNKENFDEEDLVEKTIDVLREKKEEKEIEDEEMQDVIETSKISPDRATYAYKGTKMESSKEEVPHEMLMPQFNEKNSEEEDLVENMVDVLYEIEVEEEIEKEVMQDVIETRKIPQVKVYHAYIGQGMKVEKGEVLLLIQRTNSDWWQIRKDNGTEGFVPANYVKEIQPKVSQKVIRKPTKVKEKVKVKKTVMKKEVVKNNLGKANKMIMASFSSDDFCTLCLDDDVTRQAVTRCAECEVFLCPECENHHRMSRLSKYHRIMPIEDFHKLPAFMKEISSQCKDHDKKFELYCSFHACPCCVQCVTDHQKCQDMKPLSDILSNAKSSVHLLEKDLKNMKEKLEMIINHLKNGNVKNNFQNAKAIEEIHFMRKSIDEYLNRLEQQFLDTLESKHSNLKSNMNPLIKNIEHQSVKMHKLLEEFLKMKQYATKLQIYTGVREIEKTTSIAAKYIEDLKSGGHLNRYNIEFKISFALRSILQDVKSFGEIEIINSFSTFHLWGGGSDQTQHGDQTVFKIKQAMPLMKTRTILDDIGPINVYDCRVPADDKKQTISSSSCSDFCTFCQDDNVTSQAVTICTECEVFLCQECEKHHRKVRLSQHHKTMSIEDFHKLPAFVKDISIQCKDHNMKYELFCSFHSCPCCVKCVSKHQKCQNMKPLSDIISQIKSSASVYLCENDLKDLIENFEVILFYLKRRIDENNIQRTNAVEESRTIRRSIDDYLNGLEQQILVDLKTKRSTLKSNMNTLLKHIGHQSNKISNLQEKLSKMTQYATELQMFVGLEEFEKATSEVEIYVDDLKSGGHLNENTLEIKVASHLQSISEVVKSFGEINITTSSCSVQLKTGRNDQAQDVVPGIEQIQPSLVRTLTDEIGPINICACCILPDSNFLILEYPQKQLLLFSHDGIFIKTVVTFNEFTGDLCLVRNDTVAVTFESNVNNQTAIVNMEKNEITKTIEISHDCLAVTSNGQMLVISGVGTKKSTLINLKDMSLKILEGVWGNRISLFKENIYCTDNEQKKVNCYNMTGEPIWTFMDNEINNPSGLALDINGFVYIASFGNNTIVVVSPDGKTKKTIQPEADGIIKPTGIDINRNTGMMIVPCQLLQDKPRILFYRI
ncbi:SPTB [Mytilus coruscus]|uniref:SPTB n=1 Tax=Mytilus coruscus TaxID=42192 RepID=A0A6J7ZUH3_MYTCO|nr:SPTB [Mytilus coruscus]